MRKTLEKNQKVGFIASVDTAAVDTVDLVSIQRLWNRKKTQLLQKFQLMLFIKQNTRKLKSPRMHLYTAIFEPLIPLNHNNNNVKVNSVMISQDAYKFGKMKFPEFSRFSRSSKQLFPDNYKEKTWCNELT